MMNKSENKSILYQIQKDYFENPGYSSFGKKIAKPNLSFEDFFQLQSKIANGDLDFSKLSTDEYKETIPYLFQVGVLSLVNFRSLLSKAYYEIDDLLGSGLFSDYDLEVVKIKFATHLKAIKEVASDILKIFKKEIDLQNLPEEVYIASIHTSNINSFTAPSPISGYYILFPQGFFRVMSEFSNIISKMIPKVTNSDLENSNFKIEASDITPLSDEDALLFIKNLQTHIVLGFPNIPEVVVSKETSLVNLFTTVSERFIISHEYSHILLNHFEPAFQKSININNQIDLDIFRRNIGREFEADEFALHFTLASNLRENWSVEFTCLGVEFTLCIFEIIEDALSIDINETHPPTSNRRERINSLIEMWWNLKDVELIKHNNQILRDAIQEFWKQKKYIFEASKESDDYLINQWKLLEAIKDKI